MLLIHSPMNAAKTATRYIRPITTITTSATDAIAPTNGNTVDRKNSPISSRRTNAHIPAHSPMSSGMYILKALMDMKYAIGRTDTASRTIAA